MALYYTDFSKDLDRFEDKVFPVGNTRYTFDFSLSGNMLVFLRNFWTRYLDCKIETDEPIEDFDVMSIYRTIKDNPTVRDSTKQSIRNNMNILESEGVFIKRRESRNAIYTINPEYIKDRRYLNRPYMTGLTFPKAVQEISANLDNGYRVQRGMMISELTNRHFAWSDKCTPGRITLICIDWEDSYGSRIYGTSPVQEEFVCSWTVDYNAFTMRADRPDLAITGENERQYICREVENGELNKEWTVSKTERKEE